MAGVISAFVKLLTALLSASPDSTMAATTVLASREAVG